MMESKHAEGTLDEQGESIRYEAKLNKEELERYLRRYGAMVIVAICVTFLVLVIPLLLAPLIILLCWPRITSRARAAAERSSLYVTDNHIVHQFGFRFLRIPLANVKSIQIGNGCCANCTRLCTNVSVVQAVITWNTGRSRGIRTMSFVGIENPEIFVEHIKGKIGDHDSFRGCCCC